MPPLLGLVLIAALAAQLPTTPQSISPQAWSPESDGGYSFATIGHVYGAQANSGSVLPSASITGGLPNALGGRFDFLVLLGDVVRRPDDNQIAGLKRWLERLDLPVINAPGNHEGDRGGYVDEFGPSQGLLWRGDDAFVVVDSGRVVTGAISPETTALFAHATEAFRERPPRNVFVFSHHLLWAGGAEWSEAVGRHNNAGEGPSGEDFRSAILPTIAAWAQTADVTWISGDVGTAHSWPLFMHHDPDSGVRFAAVGAGDMARDTLLIFEVDGSGLVTARAELLVDGSAVDLSRYGPADWETEFRQRAEMRASRTSLVGRVSSVLRSRRFVGALGLGFVAGIIVGWQLRSRRSS